MYFCFMRRFSIVAVVLIMILTGCQEEEMANEVSFELFQAGFKPTRGAVNFTELGPAKIRVHVDLSPIGEGEYAAHLHYGNIREVGELAYRLTPVNGETGQSVTVLDQVVLPDGELLTFEVLERMNGSVKVHQNTELFSNLVLAYGNVGANDNYLSAGIAQCTGH